MSDTGAAAGPSSPAVPHPQAGAGAGAVAGASAALSATPGSASAEQRHDVVLCAKAGTTFCIGDGVVVGPNGELYTNIWADAQTEAVAAPTTHDMPGDGRDTQGTDSVSSYSSNDADSSASDNDGDDHPN